MYNVAIIDITGKGGFRYNYELCSALAQDSMYINKVYNITPDVEVQEQGFSYIRMLQLLPKRYRSTTSRVKRIIQALQVVLNYLYISVGLRTKRISIAHFEWLPFLDFSSVDIIFLKWIKVLNPHIRIVFTMHNVFPHGMHETKKDVYIKRIRKLSNSIDSFMVHTYHTQKEFSNIYLIPIKKIGVAYHGIYKPEGITYIPTKKDGENTLRIFMYGLQDYYKGADILIEALSLLPEAYVNRTKTLIIGKTPLMMLNKYSKSLDRLNVVWKPGYYEQAALQKGLDNSDIVLLPYRAISQSAVLLEMIYLQKPVITSDLPSFVETLEGFDTNWFFKSENPLSLSNVIKDILDGNISLTKISEKIGRLKIKYSWSNSAKQTIELYNSL